ncbi:MAG: Fe-S oxidoreductase [Bacteroidetes bacterium GWF2_38_335]|nr:MAG: Fe-S oxidoreductase [Bacteroidetes bacterium GWF2_38_335]OFY77944.1 MAG: Fe-S oxidoreductase [Bacteroidetes bacterium RIFOXYA12_FULL_38_20]HBS86685.1 zinc/iron-chelating domain-containing protein [Bacteroidales bacterium]
MAFDFEQLKQKAIRDQKKNKALFERLKKKKDLDQSFHKLHDEVFEIIDCLDCANCCRSLGPRITNKDIEKLAGHFRKRPSEITEQYFRIDEDGDFVFKSMPCPFLGTDNYCAVYENRPKACREYPHTDSVKMHKLLNITLKNIPVCPAVSEIVDKLHKAIGSK